MLPPFDTVLFDFDGTLAILNLDFAEMRSQLLALTLSHGLPADALHELYMLEMIAYATAWLHRDSPAAATAYHRKAEQLLQAIETEAAQRSGLLPGVEELLHTLQQRDIAVGIVTRNCNAAVRILFPRIDAYCQAFLARDHVTQVKPHPAHLQAALARLGSVPARTLMVGDGTMDMQAGKRLQMFSIGVLSGSGTRASLTQHGADLVLDSAADLLHYLPRNQGNPV
jgi:phosphoglycolate phosphatase